MKPGQGYGELMRLARTRSEQRPTRVDRRTQQAAQAIIYEVYLAQIEVDGAFVLGKHIMGGVVGLDDERRWLANGDQVLASLLAPFEETTLRQVANVQANLYTQW